MTDLSHWDVCDEFTGHEAASLFVGIDPNTAPNNLACQPLMGCMRSAYTKALHALLDEQSLLDAREQFPEDGVKHLRSLPGRTDMAFFDRMEDEARSALYSPSYLYSLRMTAYFYEERETWESEPTERQLILLDLARDSFNRWLRRGVDTEFDHQLFHRTELARWINHQGFKSKYQFRLEPEATETSNPTLHLLSRVKRDILTPVIELAATKCRNQMDVAELWTVLQTQARERTPPLIGVTETGIQYLDANDMPKEFTKRALRERLRRLA